MPMKGNYIKLFRQITEWEHYQDGNTMRVFLHLLLNAVHDKQTAYDVQLKRGQYFTSYRLLSEELNLSTKYITESIKKLKKSGEIITERCRWGTIFTVVNYDSFQSAEPKKKLKCKDDDGIGETGHTDW